MKNIKFPRRMILSKGSFTNDVTSEGEEYLWEFSNHQGGEEGRGKKLYKHDVLKKASLGRGQKKWKRADRPPTCKFV